MKLLAGIAFTALSMVGLAHQNTVVKPPIVTVTFPKAIHLSPAAPVAIVPSAKSPKPAVVPRPVAAGVVLGTSTTDGVVTQSQLQAAIEQTSNTLRQLIYANTGSTIGKGLYATGGYDNNIALSNKIDQLDGTALTNVVVNGMQGLTTGDIPDLSTKYVTISSAGAALGGIFSSNVGIGTTSPTALLTIDSTSTTGTILRISNGDTGGHIFEAHQEIEWMNLMGNVA